jgi:hypothetical protein
LATLPLSKTLSRRRRWIGRVFSPTSRYVPFLSPFLLLPHPTSFPQLLTLSLICCFILPSVPRPRQLHQGRLRALVAETHQADPRPRSLIHLHILYQQPWSILYFCYPTSEPSSLKLIVDLLPRGDNPFDRRLLLDRRKMVQERAEKAFEGGRERGRRGRGEGDGEGSY